MGSDSSEAAFPSASVPIPWVLLSSEAKDISPSNPNNPKTPVVCSTDARPRVANWPAVPPAASTPILIRPVMTNGIAVATAAPIAAKIKAVLRLFHRVLFIVLYLNSQLLFLWVIH